MTGLSFLHRQGSDRWISNRANGHCLRPLPPNGRIGKLFRLSDDKRIEKWRKEQKIIYGKARKVGDFYLWWSNFSSNPTSPWPDHISVMQYLASPWRLRDLQHHMPESQTLLCIIMKLAFVWKQISTPRRCHIEIPPSLHNKCPCLLKFSLSVACSPRLPYSVPPSGSLDIKAAIFPLWLSFLFIIPASSSSSSFSSCSLTSSIPLGLWLHPWLLLVLDHLA